MPDFLSLLILRIVGPRSSSNARARAIARTWWSSSIDHRALGGRRAAPGYGGQRDGLRPSPGVRSASTLAHLFTLTPTFSIPERLSVSVAKSYATPSASPVLWMVPTESIILVSTCRKTSSAPTSWRKFMLYSGCGRGSSVSSSSAPSVTSSGSQMDSGAGLVFSVFSAAAAAVAGVFVWSSAPDLTTRRAADSASGAPPDPVRRHRRGYIIHRIIIVDHVMMLFPAAHQTFVFGQAVCSQS